MHREYRSLELVTDNDSGTAEHLASIPIFFVGEMAILC